MTNRQQIDKYDQYIPYPQYLKLLVRAGAATAAGIKDYGGYGRVLTVSGGATGSSTHIKINPYSLYFDGTGDYASAPTSAGFSGSKTFTISLWVYRVGTGTQIITGTNTGTASSGTWFIGWNTTDGVFFQIADSTGWYINAAMSDNTWHHIAIVGNGTTVYGYLDGVSFGNHSISVNIGETAGFYLGTDTTVTNLYTGYIDELAFWNGVAVPIEQLYPQRKPFSFRRA